MMQVTDGSPYLHENPYLYESLTTATMGFVEYISPCKISSYAAGSGRK